MPKTYDTSVWGEDLCYQALVSDESDLAEDPEFQDRFDALFADNLNYSDAESAYDALANYLAGEYDLNIDDYFDWDDWRAEHQDSP